MSNEPKKVIVSGVTGQDGSYMVDYLLANTPHLVYGMIRRTAKPDYSNLAGALNNPRFQFVTGDLSDTTSIDNVVRQVKPDYFINLAAQSFVASSWTLAESTIDITGLGVVRVLEALRKHTPQCRLYSAGSSEEWGDVIYSPQDEKHPMRPRSPYGCAKCLAHHAVKVYRESYGLYAVHGVLTNHESPRRGREFITKKITLGVARIAAAIKAGQPFEPLEVGNVNARRDWSHAKDFVEGMWLMLNQEKPTEFVLASGETHSVREFIEKAFTAAGIDGIWRNAWTRTHQEPSGGWRGHFSNDPKDEIFRLNDNDALPERDSEGTLVRINPEFFRPAEVELLWGTAERAKKELDWQPKISFDQLVAEMVKTDLAAVGLRPPI